MSRHFMVLFVELLDKVDRVFYGRWICDTVVSNCRWI